MIEGTRHRTGSVTARAAAALAVVGAAALSMAVGTPRAHADDPLPPIRNAVEAIRGQSNCTALNYRGDLEGAAQGYARAGKVSANGYPGQVDGFKNTGDPEGQAISNLLGDDGSAHFKPLNCTYKDFGVGFVRVGETDTVAIVLGIPDPPAPLPPPPPVKLPPSSDSVPAIPVPLPGLPVPAPAPPPVAPTDAVQMTLTRNGLSVNVAFDNSSDLAGKCSYTASPVANFLLPTINRTFTIGAKGSAQLTVPAPPILTTYHVVVSCRGTFDGKDVEFGHAEQDVSG